MLHTTKNLLIKNFPCNRGWHTLLEALGPDWHNDRLIPLDFIVNSNGILDALWALRAVTEEQKDRRNKLARLFICWCIRYIPIIKNKTMWDFLSDERSRNAVKIAEIYAKERCTLCTKNDLANVRIHSKNAYDTVTATTMTDDYTIRVAAAAAVHATFASKVISTSAYNIATSIAVGFSTNRITTDYNIASIAVGISTSHSIKIERIQEEQFLKMLRED